MDESGKASKTIKGEISRATDTVIFKERGNVRAKYWGEDYQGKIRSLGI